MSLLVSNIIGSKNELIAKSILVSLLIGLYGTMTNIVFISPFPSMIAFFLLTPVLIIKKNQKIPTFVLWLFAFFLFCIISTLVYYAPSLLDYNFYRYDGNLIVSYLPLLVFPFFSFKIDVERVLKQFMYFTFVLNLIFYVLYFVITKGDILFNPTGGKEFNPFFKATNAGGGFYSMLASLVLAFYLEKREKKYLVLLLFIFVFLWGTTSRGSILGFTLGTVFFIFYKNGKRWLNTTTIILILAIQAFIILNTYPYYKAYLLDSIDIGEDTLSYLSETYGSQDTKEANIYIRAFDTWPRGTALFLNSPLIGSGFGSVNDLPIKFNSGLPGLIGFNGSKNHMFNDSHAHHSYIHFLAEVGIIGITIFFIFWTRLYRFIRAETTKIPMSIKTFLLIGLYNLSIMSFTEHRITTPSNVLPFVIILCIAVINHNYESSIQKANHHQR